MKDMSREEFMLYFGITPEKAKELMILLRQIVNREVEMVISHADYYMNPTDYCDKEWLEEKYGTLEKDDDADGYTQLYEFGEEHSAVSTFMDFISFHTRHGGHTSAIEACNLMDLEWPADN